MFNVLGLYTEPGSTSKVVSLYHSVETYSEAEKLLRQEMKRHPNEWFRIENPEEEDAKKIA